LPGQRRIARKTSIVYIRPLKRQPLSTICSRFAVPAFVLFFVPSPKQYADWNRRRRQAERRVIVTIIIIILNISRSVIRRKFIGPRADSFLPRPPPPVVVRINEVGIIMRGLLLLLTRARSFN